MKNGAQRSPARARQHECCGPSSGDSRGRVALRIIIPAHNEEGRIEPTVRDYCRHFAERAVICVIANACNDGSVRLLRRLSREYANLEFLDISAPIGKGGAIRAGFKFGDEPYVGFADADHATTAAEFDRLYEACVSTASCGVIGSRWRKGATILRRQPTERRIASRAFNAVVRLLFGLPYADTQCGAKVFRRVAIAGAIAKLELADFAFDIDLLTSLRSRGCRVLEVPTVWTDSIGGTTIPRLGRASVVMLWAILRLRLRRSRLGSLPYLGWMARDSVIPVRDRLALLVLSGESEASDLPEARYVSTAVSRWQAEGHTVTAIAASGMVRRFGALVWYVISCRRRYDAIVEIRGAIPFGIPCLSAKPAYLVESRAACRREKPWQSALFRWLYGNVARVRVSGSEDTTHRTTLFERRRGSTIATALANTDELLRHISVNGEYNAAFTQSDGSWHLTFRNPGTNVLSRLKIAPESAFATAESGMMPRVDRGFVSNEAYRLDR